MAVDVVGFAVLGISPSVSEGRNHMDDTTSATLDQADEDILTPTVSDDALEGAAGNSVQVTNDPWLLTGCGTNNCS